VWVKLFPYKCLPYLSASVVRFPHDGVLSSVLHLPYLIVGFTVFVVLKCMLHAIGGIRVMTFLLICSGVEFEGLICMYCYFRSRTIGLFPYFSSILKLFCRCVPLGQLVHSASL